MTGKLYHYNEQRLEIEVHQLDAMIYLHDITRLNIEIYIYVCISTCIYLTPYKSFVIQNIQNIENI